jgi:hypothetical protein
MTCAFCMMSAMGREPTSRHVRVTSVILLKADIHQRGLHVRFVPEADMKSELAAGSGRHLADQVGTSYLPATRPYGRMKNARDAAAITAVAAQPQIAIDRDSVSRPITLGLRTISIITAISGAASTPLTTAAQ